MTLLAVSQRVAVDARYRERRDCLDQAWARFIVTCGLTPVPVPNDEAAARLLFARLPLCGVLLTGGNDLADHGGDAPERDATENALIDMAADRGMPVLGVCRGMLVILHRFGIPIDRVTGHVAPRQVIMINGTPTEVNSYHNFGAVGTHPPLEQWAVAADGVVKAVRHTEGSLTGIMWHPERMDPFAARDIALFRDCFRIT